MDKIIINNQEITFKDIVNKVFDKWICRKTRPSQQIINHIKNKPECADNLLCVLSTNPYTNDTQTLMTMPSDFEDGEVCIYGSNSTYYTMHLFADIVTEVVTDIFKMTYDEDEDTETVTYKAEYGRQFMTLLESLKSEILDMCNPENFQKRSRVFSYIPMDTINFEFCYADFENTDDWFNEAVLMKNVKYNTATGESTFPDHTYDDDRLLLSLFVGDMERIERPFPNPLSLLTALIWDKLDPKFVKYTEVFGSIDNLVDYHDNLLEFNYIRTYCKSIDMFHKAVEFGITFYRSGLDKKLLSDHFRTFNEYCQNNLLNTKTWDEVIENIKNIDSGYMHMIKVGLENALKY